MFLSQAGSLSVWLFVSQYHILMANNGQGLVVMWPKLYYLNAVVVAIVYSFLCLIVRASVGTVKQLVFSNKIGDLGNVHV